MFKLLYILLSLSVHAQDPVIMSTPEGYDAPTVEEVERARRDIEAKFPQAEDTGRKAILSVVEKNKILESYKHLDPQALVPRDLLEKALLFFDANKASLPNQNFITIVDFQPRSDAQRFFLIDMRSGAVERYFTTHGLNSNRQNFARVFGNKIGSGKSSLGFVRVAEEYVGKYQRSVRLDGISRSNSNIRARAVVIHGWDEVKEEPVVQGLSWGCITLDWRVKDAVIDRIKDGSLLLADVSKRRN